MIRLYLDDTLGIDGALVGEDGQPLDLTGATVDIVSLPDDLGGAATITDPPTGGLFTYSTPADVAGLFSLRYRVTWAGTPPTVVTMPGEAVRVTDPANMWTDSAAIEAIFGPQDPEAVARAIDAAQLLIESWLCAPVPDPLPPEFTMAATLVAGRLVQAPAPGSPISETIGDYSYRLATAPGADALRREVRQLLGQWLCGTLHSVRIWPDAPSYPCEAGAWAWGALGREPGEFQPDAEGLLRS